MASLLAAGTRVRRGDSGSTRRRRLRTTPSSRRAGAPACSACRRPGTRAASVDALQDQPADALGRLLGCADPPRRSAARRRSGDSPAQAEAARRESRRCRATCAARRSKTSRTSCCAGRLPSRRTARAYWFSTSARPSSSCCTHMQHALQDVQRLEAGDDDRHAVLRRERLVFREAHHRADVPGGQETLHAVRRRRRGSPPSPAARARARRASRSSSSPALRRLEDGHRVGRRGGLEADGEEDDLAGRDSAARARRASSGE